MKKFWTENKWSERFILLVILLNSTIIFLQESGITSPLLSVLDTLCTLIFLVEMIGKIYELGLKGYLASGWNIMDGTLVLLSFPTLVAYVLPNNMMDLSFLLILRVLRVFRFFRLVHVFPNFSNIVRNLKKALRESFAIFVGFLILIVVFALMSCALFKDASPEYFGTPLDAIYSTFRMCTVEGWYDIPDAVALAVGPQAVGWVRMYFVFILVAGGIIGLSLVNSIFVDAMVSDDNDALGEDIKSIQESIRQLREEISLLASERKESEDEDPDKTS